jgi:hypothetical protein
MSEQKNKLVQIVLLGSIIVSSIVIFCIWCIKTVSSKFTMLDEQEKHIKTEMHKKMQKEIHESRESFYNKRETRIKIYKSDEIYDPDELPEIGEYDDPDSDPMNFDPDQQPYLDDQTDPKQYRSKQLK